VLEAGYGVGGRAIGGVGDGRRYLDMREFEDTTSAKKSGK
jgi:hypothetical protein